MAWLAAAEGDAERCLDAGVDGYHSTPIRGDRMLAEIKRVLSHGTATAPR